MGIVINSFSDSIGVDLGGLSNERKYARIKLNDIRSLVKSVDDATVSIIFSSGEIYGFPFVAVTSIDGDTNITTQDILYDKLEAVVFAAS